MTKTEFIIEKGWKLLASYSKEFSLTKGDKLFWSDDQCFNVLYKAWDADRLLYVIVLEKE